MLSRWLDALNDLFKLGEEALREMAVLKDDPALSFPELLDKLFGLVTLSFAERYRHDTSLLLLTELLDLVHRVIAWCQDQQQRCVGQTCLIDLLQIEDDRCHKESAEGLQYVPPDRLGGQFRLQAPDQRNPSEVSQSRLIRLWQEVECLLRLVTLHELLPESDIFDHIL